MNQKASHHDYLETTAATKYDGAKNPMPNNPYMKKSPPPQDLTFIHAIFTAIMAMSTSHTMPPAIIPLLSIFVTGPSLNRGLLRKSGSSVVALSVAQEILNTGRRSFSCYRVEPAGAQWFSWWRSCGNSLKGWAPGLPQKRKSTGFPPVVQTSPNGESRSSRTITQ